MDFLSKVLANPQVQAGIISALIAGVVSVFVVWLTTRRSKRAAQAIRAEKLLEVYNPIETFLQEKKSLYDYVSHNKATLKKNRPYFSKSILALVDEAIKEHHEKSQPDIYIGNPVPLTPEENESMKKLEGIEKRLAPALTREINRLRKIIDEG